jgi:hypothetical protein
MYVAAGEISLAEDRAGNHLKTVFGRHQTTVLEFRDRRLLSDAVDWNGRQYIFCCR